MKKYVLLVVFFFIFPLPVLGKIPTFVPEKTIALVFSSNVYGELEPCG